MRDGEDFQNYFESEMIFACDSIGEFGCEMGFSLKGKRENLRRMLVSCSF